jgi:hypothetical protein
VTVVALLESSDKVIRSARLVLRPLRASDDARIFALFANWNVVRFLSSPPWPYAAENAREFVRRRVGEPEVPTMIVGDDESLREPNARGRQRPAHSGLRLATNDSTP